MEKKKTVDINSYIPLGIILGFLLGFLTVFAIEHSGKFSYIPNMSNIPQSNSITTYIPGDTPISYFYLKTPFGSNLQFRGTGFTVGGSDKFYEYSNVSKYYFDATIEDFEYVLYFGIGYSLIIIFFSIFRVKFS